MRDPGEVDWFAVPGRPDRYRPDVVADHLRALAAADGLVAAARSATELAHGGLIHVHSGGLMPAAAVATPFLLEIMEHGHPEARRAATALLGDALLFSPYEGYTRIGTSFGTAIPVCCAVAHHVHTCLDRRTVNSVREAAAEHWLFAIGELVDDGADTLAVGILHGRMPHDGRHDAECHTTAGYTVLDAVMIEDPAFGADTACLRLIGTSPADVPPHATLLSAEHGRDVH